MDKSHLHKILSKSFNLSDWIEVLKEVFGARQLLVQPNQIMLPSNDKAKSAFELGNFTTSDDRIIGLYKIELNENVWLERNKVGLRELLRNVYKYDVDGAIIVFEQALLALMLISYIHPFVDGNKRTARIVSNALLINHKYCPISFRTVDSVDYKKAMLLFYEQNNVTAFKEVFIEQFEFAVTTYF